MLRFTQPINVMQGPEGELGEAVPALAELDLSSSLVDSWTGVLSIMHGLPALRQIDLSQTRMSLPPRLDPSVDAVTLLQAIVLNDCQVSWSQVNALSLLLHAACGSFHNAHFGGHPLVVVKELRPPSAVQGDFCMSRLLCLAPVYHSCRSCTCAAIVLPQLAIMAARLPFHAFK